MYKVTLVIQGTRLSFKTELEDPFKALDQGRSKCRAVAAALVEQKLLKTCTPGEIEIHVDPWDPQLDLFPDLVPKKEGLHHVPKQPTLATAKYDSPR
jgi:hypothetical protein